MGILFFILLVLLIAQIGFWHTLAAILGAFLMLFVLAFLVVPLLIIAGIWMFAASFR